MMEKIKSGDRLHASQHSVDQNGIVIGPTGILTGCHDNGQM